MFFKNKKFFGAIELFLLIFIIVLYHHYKPILLSISDLKFGADFQWQPSKCLFEGINHYHSYLLKDGRCPSFMTQNGEYAHGLYVLLYPFTNLEWVKAKFLWSFTNIILVTIVAFFLSKKIKLKHLEILLVIFFILYSKITSVNIFQGQQSILILFFFVLPYISKSKYSYIFSGVSFFKYNIGYVLLLFYLVSQKYKKFILFLLPSIIGFILYCLIANTKFIDTFFQPVLLALELKTTFQNKFLLSFIINFSFFNQIVNLIFIFFLILIVNLFFIFKIAKLEDELLKISCLLILTLISMPHYGHDYILLIPLFIHSVKNYKKNLFIFKFNFLVSIYFLHFYGALPKVIEKFGINFYLNGAYTEIVILLITLILNLTISNKNCKNFVEKY